MNSEIPPRRRRWSRWRRRAQIAARRANFFAVIEIVSVIAFLIMTATTWIALDAQAAKGQLMPSDLTAVLLVGGSSRIPLVAQLVSEQLDRPVAVDTDPKNAIRIVAAPYYYTDGGLVRNSVPKPRVIPPFGTFELFVELRENAGGSGANYAIKWEAEKPDTLVSPPTIEALHSRFQAGYSVAFISRGRAISEP